MDNAVAVKVALSLTDDPAAVTDARLRTEADDAMGAVMSFSRVLEWIFRLVLGAAFLKAGYEKARDPIQFLFDIRSFHLLPDPYAALVSIGLPWLEILCALGVLCRLLYAGALTVLAGSLAVFMGAIAWSWRRGLDVSCGCFGKTDFEMTYTTHLVLNGTLLGMALWLLAREWRAASRGESLIDPGVDPGVSAGCA